MTLLAKFQVIWLVRWVHKDFLVPTGTPESSFEKSGFYQNEAKKAGEMILHESLHKNLQRSSNKAYVRSCKELCHQTAARDVMDAAARSNKVTLMPNVFSRNFQETGLFLLKCSYFQIMWLLLEVSWF